jgi:radical SAM superfamily enzyme
MANIIIPIVSKSTAPIVTGDGGARDLAMIETMKRMATRPERTRKNLTTVELQPNISRNTRVALILAPEWGPYIPPYNLARLTALSKASGYATRCFDINIAAYHYGDKDQWNGYNDWRWKNETYFTDIHTSIEPLLIEYIDKIVAFNPTVVGFSIYYSNNQCTNWIIQQLKQRLPGVRIIAGGPQATQEQLLAPELVDHIVAGEGEIIFMDLLDKFENNVVVTEHVHRHDKGIRIDLDSMPIPDYSDFDLSLYTMGTGISSEMSRGCVAKCQFCSETTFWRYRNRQALSIVDEVEFNYNQYGIKTVWFIDSLVNGDLTELRQFAQEIVARKIDINWLGYARCDHRMDISYLQDLKASGCSVLNFGVESGSNHVLHLMKKNVKREAVEQNLTDMTVIGLHAFTNWFTGFPGETQNDAAETMTLLWRTRNTTITGRNFGICNLNPDTPLSQNKEDFGVSKGHYGGHWVTNDYTNTILHRLIRYKSANIILNHLHCDNRNPDTIVSRLERPGIESHYELSYNKKNIQDIIPYETFDYDIIKLSTNPVADSLVNEIWPLLRVLWLAVGEFKLDVRFSPEIDLPEFGPGSYLNDGLRPNDYFKAHYKFEIDRHGAWTADFVTELEAGGPNGNPTMDGKTYAFTHTWQGTGIWDRSAI